MEPNQMVLLQYAKDLRDVGIINSKSDFLSYFQQHGAPGEELQVAQQVVHDYCTKKWPIALAENVQNDAEILCRLFPKYEPGEAQLLLKIFTMFSARENRLQLLLYIMSLHTRMLSKIENRRNGTDLANNTETNNDKVLTQRNKYLNLQGNYEHYLPQGNTRPDLNEYLNASMPKSTLIKRTPTATVVRPEDLDETVGPVIAPNEVLNYPETKRVKTAVTCKPLHTLIEDSAEEYEDGCTWPHMTSYLLRTSQNTTNVDNVQQENAITSFNTNSDVPMPDLVKEVDVQMLDAFYEDLEEFIENIDPTVNENPADFQPIPHFHDEQQGHEPKAETSLAGPWINRDPVDQPATHFHDKQLRYEPKAGSSLADLMINKELLDFPSVSHFHAQGFPHEPKAGSSRPEMPRPKILRNRRQNVPLRPVSPRPYKYQRLNNQIVLNDDSEDGSIESDEGQTDLTATNGLYTTHYSKEPAGAGASYCIKLCSHVMEMFPDACPTYVKELCIGRKMIDVDVDEVLKIMFSNPDYPKRDERRPTPPHEMDLDEQTKLLKEIFPEADPTHLEFNAAKYLGDPDGIRMFISETLEKRNYPTKKDYLRRQQINAQVREYTTEFNVDKFLEIIPDPVAYFDDGNRRTITDKDVVEPHLCGQVLKNLYPHITVRHIAYLSYNNLMAAAKMLDNCTDPKKMLKKVRRHVPVDLSTLHNIPLLQEIAFLTNRELILGKVEERKQQELWERENAKANGLMQVCRCCYDEEIMLKDCVTCEKRCNFCKTCVQKSVEIIFSEGKTEFPCLDACSSHFNLTTLRDALPPKLFSKIVQRKQLEEIKAAGIDDLVMCPFCDFATIPPPSDKIFKCLNPECMKESCRKCKEPSHVPLRCDEIEKDNDVKKRTYIENKMTEALVRVCYKCGMKFIKEDGCNKMTCSCGAQMCYLCLAPVKDYTHFNGQGGDKLHLCPLYSDTNSMHKDQVLRGAAEAKQELGVADDELLKIDPTADVHQHYAKHYNEQAAIPIDNDRAPHIRVFVNAVMQIEDELHHHLHQQHQLHRRRRHH